MLGFRVSVQLSGASADRRLDEVLLQIVERLRVRLRQERYRGTRLARPTRSSYPVRVICKEK